jgi:hypothetical protein
MYLPIYMNIQSFDIRISVTSLNYLLGKDTALGGCDDLS